MPDVQFDETNEIAQYRSRVVLGDAATPKMVMWLLKHGIVKSEKTAGLLLIIITVLFFSLSAYIYFHYVH